MRQPAFDAAGRDVSQKNEIAPAAAYLSHWLLPENAAAFAEICMVLVTPLRDGAYFVQRDHSANRASKTKASRSTEN